MKAKILICCLTAAIAIYAANAQDAQTVTFKPFSEPGKYVIIQEMTAAGINKADEFQYPQTMSQLMAMYLDVYSPDSDGGRKIDMAYKYIRVKNKYGAIEMNYDSSLPADKQDPKIASFYNVIKDARVSMVCDQKGKVTSVVGMDEIFDAVAKNDAQAAAIMEQMKKQFGNEAIKAVFTGNMQMFPESPVAIGQGWSKPDKLNLPILGAIDITMDYKLEKIEDSPAGKIALVAINGTFTGGTDQAAEVGNGKIIMKKVVMKLAGTSRVEIARGLPVETIIDQTIHSEATLISADGKSAEATSDSQQRIKTAIANRKEGQEIDSAYTDTPKSTLAEMKMPVVATRPTTASAPATTMPAVSKPAIPTTTISTPDATTVPVK